MQTFSIPWQKPDSQIPQSNFQPPQTNIQKPQQINQIRPINTQSPQIVNQQPQSNFLPPQPTNPVQRPMLQGQWPTNQMSNFQQPQSNSQKRAGENVVTEEDDDRPVWGNRSLTENNSK